MPIVSIDNENDEQNSADKPYNASDMRRVPVGAASAAPEKVVIRRPQSAQLRASYKRIARKRRISTIFISRIRRYTRGGMLLRWESKKHRDSFWSMVSLSPMNIWHHQRHLP